MMLRFLTTDPVTLTFTFTDNGIPASADAVALVVANDRGERLDVSPSVVQAPTGTYSYTGRLGAGLWRYAWTAVVGGVVVARQAELIEVVEGGAYAPRLASVIDQVHRRTGLLARRQRRPDLATLSSDEETLAAFGLHGGAEIATRTGRVEARATVALVAGQSEYPLALSVYRPQRATITRTGADGTLQTYDLPQVDGARARAVGDTGAEGEVACYGLHAGRLFVAPVPQEPATLRLYYLAGNLVGETEGAFASDETASDVQVQAPEELERMLVDYVVSEWLRESGEHGLADPIRARYLSDLEEQAGNPRIATRTERRYRPTM